jgi:dienelactone hydrolase
MRPIPLLTFLAPWPLIAAAIGPASLPVLNPEGQNPGALSAFLAPSAPWTALSILTSDAPNADFEAVQLRTQDDLHLTASFYPPRGKRESRSPGAILVHDAGRHRGDLSGLASALQKRGFAVLTLDLRGHGDSRTEAVAFDSQDTVSAERMWAFTLRDLESAASFLRSRSEVHASNLSLVGVGAGAAIAARHAVRDGNARAVVLIAPREENLGFNLVADLKGLGGLPTLILAERDRKPDADRLAHAGNSAEGLQYIEVAVLRTNGSGVLEDARLPREVTRHLHDNVTAKR